MLLKRIVNFEVNSADLNWYEELDDQWIVAVADVVSSTDLATRGKDRDINFIAAAAVAAVSHLLKPITTLPAVQFGGDGITAACPIALQEPMTDVLAALAYWAKDAFGINLRVGIVAVKELKASGFPVYASLQQMGEQNAFALFLGKGITEADRWVKEQPERQIQPKAGLLPGLENLSCRWQPLPSRQGKIISLIVDPVHEGDLGIQHIRALMDEIHELIQERRASPLGNGDELTPPSHPSIQSLKRELSTPSTRPKPVRILGAYLGSALLWLGWRLGGRFLSINSKRYLNTLALHSDFRKQAGGPRMVLDLSLEEIGQLLALLDKGESRNEIVYGYALSEATSLTCLVEDFQADEHVHFVDGDKLGFWRASIMLKEKKLTRR